MNIMTTISKVLLAASITTLVISFTPAGSDVWYGILRPAGALAFIAFFISNVLAREMALWDQEHRSGHSQDQSQSASRKTVRHSSRIELAS